MILNQLGSYKATKMPVIATYGEGCATCREKTIPKMPLLCIWMLFALRENFRRFLVRKDVELISFEFEIELGEF